MDAQPVSRSYLDFEGLGQLKGQARTDSKAALRQTAQQFEALFLQMTMKSMRDSVVKSDLIESSTSDQFESMFDKEVSVQLSKRNSMGLADMLVKSLEARQASTPATADVLKARDTSAQASPSGIALNTAQVGLSLQAAKKAMNELPRPQGAMLLTAPKRSINGGAP
jgi:Rod binding domain-containing protein